MTATDTRPAPRPREARAARSHLEVVTWGEGERVLLVHGSLLDGPATWAQQIALSESWELCVVQRRGFGDSPASDGEDFQRDADDLCTLLAEPAHVVAHAYGALGALLAVARRTRRVRSLTVVEPTAVTVDMDDPEIAEAIGAIADWWLDAPRDRAQFLAGYAALIGVRAPDLGDGRASLREAARYLRHCRPAWTADIDWDRIARAQIPTLAISGGHAPALDAVAAAVARRTGGRHAVIKGAGHVVQRASGSFNALLSKHLGAAAG